MNGIVKRWLSGRGYGFIQADELDKEVFVHYTGLKSQRDLIEGDKVQFDVIETEKGPKAINVETI